MSGSRSDKLDTLLINAALSYDKLSKQMQEYAVTHIDKIRLELQDLLLTYAGNDDLIKRQHIQSILDDLNVIQAHTKEAGMEAMTDVVKQAGELGVKNSNDALQASIGADVTGNTMPDEVFSRLSTETVRYVVNRFGQDGLVLSDRVWKISSDQRNALEQVIKMGIIKGTSVNSMVAQVRKVYANDSWKIKRLVVTESNIAYRTGSAYVAQQSPFVKGLRIHRGWHDVSWHRCSELEKIDRYGLGAGIYLPSDPEVLNPHPNCTSYITYELIDDVPTAQKKASKSPTPKIPKQAEVPTPQQQADTGATVKQPDGKVRQAIKEIYKGATIVQPADLDTDKQHITADDIKTFIDQIPAKHHDLLGVINLFDTHDQDSSGYVYDKAVGGFNLATKEIEIYRNDWLNEGTLKTTLAGTIRHEYAHVLEERLGAKFVKDWKKAMKKEGGAITDYAATDFHEDIAETVRHYWSPDSMERRMVQMFFSERFAVLEKYGVEIGGS